MARISFVDGKALDQALGGQVDPDVVAGMSYATRIWAHRPDLLAAVVEFQRVLREGSTLGARLDELVRLRVAFHNQCRTCMARRSPDAIADGLSEELVCELARPDESEILTERERVALAYADKLAADHLSISDEVFGDLARVFTEAEVVELGAHIAWCIGMGRLTASWDVIDDLPERFNSPGEQLAPWTVAPIDVATKV
jgi:AhpD family alkylhydroperoxidase